MYAEWCVLAGKIRFGDLRNIAGLNFYQVNSDRVARGLKRLICGKDAFVFDQD